MTQDKEPITFYQNTISEDTVVGSLLISGPDTGSPPQGFMVQNLSMRDSASATQVPGLQHPLLHLTLAL